jgi:hypothetical protein
MKPYTYVVGWSKHNKYYYGCRHAKVADPTDLWVSYFTSSNYVAVLRDMYGEPDVVRIHKTFETPRECVNYERRIIRKLINRPHFINMNVAGSIVGGNPYPRTEIQKQSAKKLMTTLSKGVWYTNGIQMKRCKIAPLGWIRGYPQWYKDKIASTLSEHYINKEWFNNGTQRRKYNPCQVPGGWTKGWHFKKTK